MLYCLLSARAITEQECNAVKQKPHTLQASTLIDTVLAKGNTAATSFRNSLREIDPALYRDIFVQQDIRSLPTDDIAALPMEEQLRKLQEERMCKVCMDREVSIVFIPCGHLVVCKDCAPSLRKCPICRGTIKGTVRTFLSWTRLMVHGCNFSQEEVHCHSQLHSELEASLDSTRHRQTHKYKHEKLLSEVKNEWITYIIILIGFLKSAICSQLRKLFSVNIFTYYLHLKYSYIHIFRCHERGFCSCSWKAGIACTPEILRKIYNVGIYGSETRIFSRCFKNREHRCPCVLCIEIPVIYWMTF